jgi:hypothetical protein
MSREIKAMGAQPSRDHVLVRTTESKAAAAARIGAGLAGRKRAEVLGLERNGWTIAQHAGDGTLDRTQRLLNRAAW